MLHGHAVVSAVLWHAVLCCAGTTGSSCSHGWIQRSAEVQHLRRIPSAAAQQEQHKVSGLHLTLAQSQQAYKTAKGQLACP